MYKLLTLFLLLFINILLFAQNDTNNLIIENYKIKKIGKLFKKAVILNNSYDNVKHLYFFYGIDSIVEPYTPTRSDIRDAEFIFYKKYNINYLNSNHIDYFEITLNVRKKYLNYYRQYIGMITINKEKIIFVKLLNFNNRLEAKKYFKNWDKELINGTGKFYEKNCRRYLINISKGILYSERIRP
jgi:hypothetical protein